MKDIDFDELDRAVSSVLGQQGPKDEDAVTVQTTAVTTTADKVSETDPGDKPVAAAETESPAPAEQPASPTTPLAVKRRGKFMDVMHPSHDMTSATAAAPVKPARTSPVLQPLSTDVTPDVPAQMPAEPDVIEPTAELDESHALIGAEPAPVEHLLPEHLESDDTAAPQTETADDAPSESIAPAETAPAEAATQEEDGEPVKSLYVDPLELAGPEEQATEEVDEDDTETEAAQPAESPAEPSGTPFLTDAQVDKRPLGAFGEAEGAAAPEAAAPAPGDTQAAPAVPLPRELQPDVVEVESSAQEAETSPAPFASGLKAAETDDGRVEGHPLFDTSTYHEPIAAVHGKGMPGWAKWLIGLLICLVLGAGVGYFLFTAGL